MTDALGLSEEQVENVFKRSASLLAADICGLSDSTLWRITHDVGVLVKLVIQKLAPNDPAGLLETILPSVLAEVGSQASIVSGTPVAPMVPRESVVEMVATIVVNSPDGTDARTALAMAHQLGLVPECMARARAMVAAGAKVRYTGKRPLVSQKDSTRERVAREDWMRLCAGLALKRVTSARQRAKNENLACALRHIQSLSHVSPYGAQINTMTAEDGTTQTFITPQTYRTEVKAAMFKLFAEGVGALTGEALAAKQQKHADKYAALNPDAPPIVGNAPGKTYTKVSRSVYYQLVDLATTRDKSVGI